MGVLWELNNNCKKNKAPKTETGIYDILHNYVMKIQWFD